MAGTPKAPPADAVTTNGGSPIRRNAPSSLSFWRAVLCALVALGLLAAVIYGPSAWSAYQNRRLRSLSLPQLETVVKSRPENANAHYYLGLAYVRANRYRDAVRELLATLDRDPNRADVLNDLGVTYLLQERYYEALVALQGATTASPNFAAAYANLGRLHLTTKMPFTAARELARSVQLDPNNVDALCDLGLADQQTLNYKTSEESFRRALRIEPRNLRAHVGLARVLYSVGQIDNAQKELNAALARDPNDAAALIEMGKLRAQTAVSPADLESASQIFTRVIQIEPRDAVAWYEQGRIQLRLGRPAEAVKTLTQALQVSPGYTAALNQLQRALRAEGKTAEADRIAAVVRDRLLRDREETRLEERITRAPQDWDARARLTELYILSGKRGLAMLLCKQLQEDRPDHPRLPMLLRMLNPPAAPDVPSSLLEGGH